ncbi:MAG: substrate-binding domain-containing protein [Pirellulaceae bacterium]|nr:substrate-binding domain-containing protein [Pirellulaceae bacterium]
MPLTASGGVLRLATTTSTHDSGLLDEIIPEFEHKHNVRVDIVAAGTGRALKLGEAGDVDVVLVHAREEEEAFLASGHATRREDVMFNTFEILGPPDDPAQIRNLFAGESLQKIARQKEKFISRGDDSGTHKREQKIWQTSGGFTLWSEYLETGQGMASTLMMAHEKQAYVLVDRGTYLRFQRKIELVPLAATDDSLRNPYGVLNVNPAKSSAIKAELSQKMCDFLISPITQQRIKQFSINGESLFFPLHLD